MLHHCVRLWRPAAARGVKYLATNATVAPKVVAAPSTTRHRVVGWWLMGTSGLVFGTVVIGGLTRLTESGLSIVDWRPVAGSIPPLSLQDWQHEFDKYQQSPEYKLTNTGMSLDEFKKIFWMEWGHRQLGRTIGLIYLLPATYFIARKWVTRPMAVRLIGIGGLIGFQGLLGWLMVKSGLDERIYEERAVPRVSQYRLAAHLGTAFVIYMAGVWNGLNLLKMARGVDAKNQQLLVNPGLNRLRAFSVATVGLVFATALTGAFVAGLDAGLVYNEFPLMGGLVIPGDLLSMKPWWSNMTENPVTVQFNHRYAGMSTAAATSALWLYGRRLPLPRSTRIALNCVGGMALVQATLGIATLLTYVPISLASAHQTGSITLLTLALWLAHTLRHIPKV